MTSRPERTPEEIGRSIADGCLGLVRDHPKYESVHRSVRYAVEATITREREAAAEALSRGRPG